MKSRMRALDLWNMFWRCFIVQGSWNHMSMLGLGFGFSAIPFIKRIYKTRKQREECLRRHLDFFNSHPYFASWCLGAVAKLEEEAHRKKWGESRPIEIFKERLVGPLGAIGDRLFWNGLKPAAAGLGVFLALTAGWIAIPVFLVVYNIPHLLVRIYGLREGYRKGFDIVSELSVRRYQKWFDGVGLVGSAVAGACLVAAVRWSALGGHVPAASGYEAGMLPATIFIAALLLTLVALRFNKSRHLTLLGAALLGLLISLAWSAS
ncbi:MAG TPA: PTS system mannose/fructose/sorbose family transporter subunit IID [bacterium]|nr:PTS system mannose/fructose/sorbose family transporter subunit IID [bacterium]HQJ63016.1 PTS system mannose/fructose/sorbose family transporter subunit IID [bacterium]